MRDLAITCFFSDTFIYLFIPVFFMEKDQLLATLDLSDYLGEWVVICDNKIIAHNKKLTNLQREISSCKKTPTIAKIPKKETLIFYVYHL